MTVCNYITDVWADMNTLPQVRPTVIPSKRSAATIYLASLAPSGRRAIKGRLQSVADMFNCPFDSMPWHELRYEHMEAIRARLQESGLAPSLPYIILTYIMRMYVLTMYLRMM